MEWISADVFHDSNDTRNDRRDLRLWHRFYFINGPNVMANGIHQSKRFQSPTAFHLQCKHCIANNVSFTNQKQIALHLMEHPLVTKYSANNRSININWMIEWMNQRMNTIRIWETWMLQLCDDCHMLYIMVHNSIYCKLLLVLESECSVVGHISASNIHNAVAFATLDTTYYTRK